MPAVQYQTYYVLRSQPWFLSLVTPGSWPLVPGRKQSVPCALAWWISRINAPVLLKTTQRHHFNGRCLDMRPRIASFGQTYVASITSYSLHQLVLLSGGDDVKSTPPPQPGSSPGRPSSYLLRSSDVCMTTSTQGLGYGYSTGEGSLGQGSVRGASTAHNGCKTIYRAPCYLTDDIP